MDARDRKANESADSRSYWRFTGPHRLEKALNTLQGILRGISADGIVTEPEVNAVRAWESEHREFAHRHPFNEILPALATVLADGVIDMEEVQDLLWLCDRLSKAEGFFDAVSADMQRLQGIIDGILMDDHITKDELDGLQAWMDERENLKGCWPFDELESVITHVLQDGRIDEDEHDLLCRVFVEFANFRGNRAVTSELNHLAKPVKGICSVCPELVFPDKQFCVTGTSDRCSRRELAAIIEERGGRFARSVTRATDYLVIGADGNQSWAFSCYGRKVEQAMNLRKKGHPVTLVHELDFWDAIAD